MNKPYIVAAFCLAAVSCTALGAPQAAPATGGNNATPVPFDKLDVDGDGSISRDEAELELPLAQHFDAFDTDGTNRIDNREYQKYLDY